MAFPFTKRYAAPGFIDSNGTRPADAQALNAIEDTLVQLAGDTPALNEIPVWDGSKFVFQKLDTNQVSATAAIPKSKLASLGIVDADVAGGAAIAKSKLAALNIVDADVSAISGSKISDASLEGRKIAQHVGTSLPGSPSDGDVAVLVDSTTAPTYAWRFIYIAGISDANKWVFIGGSPLYAEVATSEATNTTATYQALATAGPSVTLPRAGNYVVEHGAHGTIGASTGDLYMSYDIGGTGAVDADAVRLGQSASDNGAMSRKKVKNGLTAVALTCKYKPSNAQAVTFANRWISVTPIRVA